MKKILLILLSITTLCNAQRTTTLTGIVNKGTFSTTSTSTLGGNTYVAGTLTVSNTSTLTGIQNNGNTIITGSLGVANVSVTTTSTLTGLINNSTMSVSSTSTLTGIQNNGNSVNTGSLSATSMSLSSTANLNKIIIAANTLTTTNSAPIKLTVTGSSLLATPEAGVIEINEDGVLYSTETSTQRKSLCGAIFTQTAPVTVANTTVATSILTNTFSFPANFFKVGKTVDLEFIGFHSAVLTPTVNITISLNGTTIVTTGNISTGNSTNNYCNITNIITCASTGTNGAIWCQGVYRELGGGTNNFEMVNTTTKTINTTIPQVFDIKIQWQIASASNSVTFTNGSIKIIN